MKKLHGKKKYSEKRTTLIKEFTEGTETLIKELYGKKKYKKRTTQQKYINFEKSLHG